ncbi:MAG: hypothetical protein JZD41_02440 [Thermoproteus sp.]|nr:hypothetical protein [Thermoproteus sp.]
MSAPISIQPFISQALGMGYNTAAGVFINWSTTATYGSVPAQLLYTPAKTLAVLLMYTPPQNTARGWCGGPVGAIFDIPWLLGNSGGFAGASFRIEVWGTPNGPIYPGYDESYTAAPNACGITVPFNQWVWVFSMWDGTYYWVGVATNTGGQWVEQICNTYQTGYCNKGIQPINAQQGYNFLGLYYAQPRGHGYYAAAVAYATALNTAARMALWNSITPNGLNPPVLGTYGPIIWYDWTSLTSGCPTGSACSAFWMDKSGYGNHGYATNAVIVSFALPQGQVAYPVG